MDVASVDAEIIDYIHQITSRFFSPERNKETFKYNLTFTFDDSKYSTVFLFDNQGITNGCVEITYEDPDSPNDISSSIKSNSSLKKCFTPILSKDSLPHGVTQTDLLQVLISKLKFGYLRKPVISLIDNARVPNPVNGQMYKTMLSEWRLLRNEPSMYEKYGYTSSSFDLLRLRIRDVTWKDIKDSEIPHTGKTLMNIWSEIYGSTPKDDESIPAFMMRLSMADVEKSLTTVQSNTETRTMKTIVHIIYDILKNRGIHLPSKRLHLKNNSDVWKTWNARLLFRSLEPVAVAGARHRRHTRRRHRHGRRSRKLTFSFKRRF